MPRAMRGAGHHTRSTAGGSIGGRMSLEDGGGGGAAGGGGGVLVDEALLLLESRLHRPHTHPCQVRE